MKYIHGLGRLPLMEIGDNGAEKIIIFDGNGAVGIRGAENLSYLIKDHLGSTRVVMDKDGSKVGEFNYKEFGETLENTEPGKDLTDIKHRYTGQEWDEELGQYNYLAREYDPGIGRFDSIDPAREGFSPYVYVGNNPVNFLDPDGKQIKLTETKKLKKHGSNEVKVRFYEDDDIGASPFDSTQQDILLNSVNQSLDILESNISLLDSGDKDKVSAITTYFGEGHNPNDIKMSLKSMYYGLQNEAFIKYTGKDSSVIMMSVPGNRSVSIDVNVKYLNKDIDVLAGYIIHEASHKYLNTDDQKIKTMGGLSQKTAYNEKQVKKLAKLDSQKALKNADSWRLFTMSN